MLGWAGITVGVVLLLVWLWGLRYGKLFNIARLRGIEPEELNSPDEFARASALLIIIAAAALVGGGVACLLGVQWAGYVGPIVLLAASLLGRVLERRCKR